MTSTPKIPAILETLLESSTDPSVILDTDRRVLFYNPAYERLVPHSAAELRRLVAAGTRCVDLFPLSICEKACAGCESLDAGGAVSKSGVQTLGGGPARTLTVHATGSADGYAVETFKGLRTDASQGAADPGEPAAPDSQRQPPAERAGADAVDAAHQQLVIQEKMSALGRLVAGIAHELNNPINFVYGNVDFLEVYFQDLKALIQLFDESDEIGPKLRKEVEERKEEIGYETLVGDCSKLIEAVRAGAERSASIVQDLKNFSRTSATSFHEFDLVRGVETTLNLIGPLIKNRIEIRRHYAEDVPLIRCNGGHINQVLMNLLANAAQAIEGEGVIDISLETIEAGEQVRIQIADSGEGILEEDRAKITDPFFTTKDVGEGSGLGLWVTLGIVHRHGGLLACKSEPGNGAIFTVTLPVSPGKLPENET